MFLDKIKNYLNSVKQPAQNFFQNNIQRPIQQAPVTFGSFLQNQVQNPQGFLNPQSNLNSASQSLKPLFTATQSFPLFKPVIDSGQQLYQAAKQELYHPSQNIGGFVKNVAPPLIKTTANVVGAAELLSNPQSLIPTVAGFGGFGAAMNIKDPVQGAIQGIESAPLLHSVGSLVNPVGQQVEQTLTSQLLPKGANTLKQKALEKGIAGVGNIPFGLTLRALEGQNPLDPGGIAADIAFGGANKVLDNKFGGKVKGAIGRTPNYLDPEDSGYYYRAQDILKDKKSTPQQLNEAKTVLYNLAERYLSPQERPESGGVKSIIKALEEKANQSHVHYGDSPFMMGIKSSDSKKPSQQPAIPKEQTREYVTVHVGGVPKTVQGVPVKVANGLDTFVHEGTGGWVVSETSSGRYMAVGKTKQEAILNAQKAVQDIGIDNVRKIIAQKQLNQSSTPPTPTGRIQELPDVTQPNYTPITLKDGKVQVLKPKENLKQLITPSNQYGESVAETRGRLMASQLKTEKDPFLRGLQKDMQGMGGEPPAPPNQSPSFTQADAEQAAGRAQAQAETNYQGFKKIFAHLVGKRDVAKTTGVEVGSKFKDIPAEYGPEVIKYIENPSDKAPAEVKQYAGQIRQEFDRLYKDATNSGIEMGYLDNYITHIWDKPQEEVQAMYKAAKQRGFFQNERSVPTYEEGIKMGLKPKYTTPQQILAEYTRKLEEVKANIDFFKQLKTEGLIVDSSVGAGRPGFEPLTGLGFPKSVSARPDGRVVQGFYYAPSKIAQTINKVFNPETQGGGGKLIGLTGKLAGKLQDITLSGGIPFTPVNAFTAANVQKELLAGRLKSPIKSIIVSTLPKASYRFFQENAPQIKKMQERNIPISSNYDIESLIPKSTARQIFGSNLGELWGKAVNDPTFKRFMPMLQVNLFNDVEKQALKSGVTPQEAADIAAKAVKNFYGVIGSDQMATRGKVGESLKSTFLFAPKFRESMINFWLNNLKSISPIHGEFNNTGLRKIVPTGAHFNNPLSIENRTNLKFLTAATTMLIGMDQANRFFNNGRSMKDNPPGTEDKLLIPLGNGQVVGIPFLSSIATVPRGIAREALMVLKGDVSGAIKDAGQTYASPLVKPLADIAANSDYFGKQIVDDSMSTPEKFKAMAQYLKSQYVVQPTLKEIFDPRNQNDPAYQRLARAMEIPLRFYTEKSLNAKYYYGAKDNALSGLNEQERNAYNSIPKLDQTDPNNPDNRILKYQIYLTYPKVFEAKQQIELDLARRTDKAIDPLYLVDYNLAKKYMRYEALPEGSQDRKDLLKANPELGVLFDVRGQYFDQNPIEGGGKSTRPIASDYVKQQMNLKNWKDPQVRAYLDANTAYNNDQRAKLGLTPTAGYSPYNKKKRAGVTFSKKLTSGKTSQLKLKLPKNKTVTTKVKLPELRANLKPLYFKNKPLKLKRA